MIAIMTIGEGYILNLAFETVVLEQYWLFLLLLAKSKEAIM
jgi:hypothetical protein